MIPSRVHWRAMNDAKPTAAPNQLTPSLGENKTFIPNHTARFSTTPTTAAVMPERVVESLMFSLTSRRMGHRER
jgi:hypothetical protein